MTINPVQALVIDDAAFALQHKVDTAVSEAAALHCDRFDALHQIRVITAPQSILCN